MSFCLNCGNHKTCQCAGPPSEARTHSEDSAGAKEPGIHKGKGGYYCYRSEEDGTEWWIHPNVMEAVKDSFSEPLRTPGGYQTLYHPATNWFYQQVEDGNLPPSFVTESAEGLRYLMTKAFNAGSCHACREIRDVIPDGPLADCCRDEFQFAIEDIDAICAEWLG